MKDKEKIEGSSSEILSMINDTRLNLKYFDGREKEKDGWKQSPTAFGIFLGNYIQTFSKISIIVEKPERKSESRKWKIYKA